MRRVFPWLLALILLGPVAVLAQTFFEEVPLTDLLEVVVLNGEILAIDAHGGGQVSQGLHLQEEVLWYGSRGRVGAVITNERLLAVSIGSGSWRQTRFERKERRPGEAQLGDRVGVVVTNDRALGFGSSGEIFEYRLGPREEVLGSRVGENVAVVITSRKAVAMSVSGGFVEMQLQLKEKLRNVSVRSNVATITTDRRLLIFRGPTRSWAEQRLELRQSG